MRLIDADAVLQYLREKLSMFDSVDEEMGLVPTTIRNDLQGFVETILEQPTVPADTRWVRCGSFVLPKPGQVCLVYDEDGYMSVATYTGDKYFPNAYGFHVNGEEVTDITHWMPIEPPKEE